MNRTVYANEHSNELDNVRSPATLVELSLTYLNGNCFIVQCAFHADRSTGSFPNNKQCSFIQINVCTESTFELLTSASRVEMLMKMMNFANLNINQ